MSEIPTGNKPPRESIGTGRRRFLKLAGTSTLASILAACGLRPPSTPDIGIGGSPGNTEKSKSPQNPRVLKEAKRLADNPSEMSNRLEAMSAEAKKRTVQILFESGRKYDQSISAEYTDNSGGTGVVLFEDDNKAVILTAKHVVSPEKEEDKFYWAKIILNKFHEGMKQVVIDDPYKWIDKPIMHPELDLAIVVINKDPDNPFSMTGGVEYPELTEINPGDNAQMLIYPLDVTTKYIPYDKVTIANPDPDLNSLTPESVFVDEFKTPSGIGGSGAGLWKEGILGGVHVKGKLSGYLHVIRISKVTDWLDGVRNLKGF
ncbi:MAG: hypothetical protein UV73_C0008G0048 [Candidatus Gottesmanbacteria bacterium GW2011_GWA2_43_14]|uniref:Serine protease n=1 Tax=Candidatus Gottesmanbacteria bacterium GW2011_GWA2_43_14 TaxID=1618443 RepID=A0A0G1GF86_9BACT|nr:MAG: hypothetical protein UV73_C0008G0048 [Candidatus Gottesmanbacteria bacterium GW2011_GWA2_43_14]